MIPAADSGVIDVRGQVLELDLYDADEGVFQGKDDFLGRILTAAGTGAFLCIYTWAMRMTACFVYC